MTTFLSYSILILLGIGVLHIVYDFIVLPSVRLRFRYKLFALRDELRMLKIENAEGIDNDAFKYLQESLNIAANILSRFDVYTAYHAEKLFGSKPDLMKRIEKRNEIMKNCQNTKYQELLKKRSHYLIFVFLANSFFLILWTLPFLLGYLFMKKFAFAWKRLNQNVKNLVSVPERESGQLDSLCIG